MHACACGRGGAHILQQRVQHTLISSTVLGVGVLVIFDLEKSYSRDVRAQKASHDPKQ